MRHRKTNAPASWRRLVLVLVLLFGLLQFHQLATPVEATPVEATPVSAWNSSYAHKQAMSIQTQDALPAGYSIQVTIDHAALVAAGQSLSSGNDVRIANWNGVTWQELDRVLAVGSAWNTATTKIYFRTKNAIAASSINTDYFVYFGYPSAGSPPANANNVYDLFDDFNDNSIDGAKWFTYGNVAETGGEMRINDTDSADYYQGFNTHGSYGSGYTGEVSLRVATQTAAIEQNSVSSIGFADMGLSSSGSTTKKVSVWSGSDWDELGESRALQGNTYAYQRVSMRYAGNEVRWYENGVHVQTRHGNPNTTSFYVDFAAMAAGSWDVRADDVVIRKHVSNEPTAILPPTSAPATFNAAYSGRQALSIATAEALPSGYSLSTTFNHAALVTQGLSLSSGNDIRVARWNGSAWSELDRVLAIGSSWNSTTTKIFFRTQAGINANTLNAQYYLYFGNPSAGSPPANAGNVYDVFDDFGNATYNGSFDSSKWSRSTAPGITTVQTGGELRISGTSQSGSESTPSKLTSSAGFTTDYVAEATFAVVASTATLNSNWAAQFGPKQDALYLDKRYGGGSIGHLNGSHLSAGTTSLQSQTFSGQRVSAGIVGAGGLARHWENGALRASRNNASVVSHGAEFAFQANVSSQALDVRFDNIVVRKQVAQEPMVSLVATSAIRPTISTGDGHSCIVAVNNAGMCWGGDGSGQLGNGATTGTQSAATLVTGGHTWATISAGYNFTCGVTTAGVGYCWGSDSVGQLGNGATTGNQTSPSPVTGGHTWATIVVSRNAHACGITTSNDAYCWGSDLNGRLGDGGADTNTNAPSPVTGSHKWSSISPGTAQTCGVTLAGAGYCWGLDSSGQLGDPTDLVSKANPMLIAGGHTWRQLTSGAAFSCGLTVAGVAYCWGFDGDERLGNGAGGNALSPGLVAGSHTFTSIASGDYHSCGIKTDTTLVCWGAGAWNQIGDGDLDNESTPVAPTGTHFWDSISGGNDSTCGVIKATGFPKCWGRNDASEVGDGSATARSTPVDAWLNVQVYAHTGDQDEGNSGTSIFNLATRTFGDRVPVIPVTVDWSTNDYYDAPVSATAGSDYVAASGTTTIQPGQFSGPIPITINGDTTVEPDELFELHMDGTGPGGEIGDGWEAAQINNDDVETDQAPNSPTALAQTRTNGVPIPGTSLYNFDAGTQGWVTSGPGTSLNHTTAVKRTGAGAARVEIVNGQAAWASDNVASARDLSANGPTFNAWVYLPPDATGTGWESSIEILGGNDVVHASSYTGLTPGYWTYVTFTPPAGVTSSMKHVAVHTRAGGANATGTNNIYIDDVQQGAGLWTNEGSVRFTASATDVNTADTLALCIEAQLVGTPFTNTETSCGSASATTSGSPVALVHTLSGPAGLYHWQARTRDSTGLYSPWVSYGGNTESSGDVGVDNAGPAAGTVRDGPSQGVDGAFNDGSLDSLALNWSGFTDSSSGIASYQFALGTTPGGTEVRNWTTIAASPTTASGLTLRTGVTYYASVRAVDALGQVGAVGVSTGQQVAPTLTFGVSNSEIAFDSLNVGNSLVPATESIDITTSTNSYNGYVVRQSAAGPMSSGANSIPFYAGTYGSPTEWTGTGFGYTSSDAAIQSSGNLYSNGTRYAGLSTAQPGDIVADNTTVTSGSPIDSEVFTLTYKVAALPTQPAGRYSAVVLLSATALY